MRHSVLNAEAFTAVFFLLILLARIRPVHRSNPEIQLSDRFLCVALCAVVLIAFLPALGMPLLHDSYGHVYSASREDLGGVLKRFSAHPQRGDFFFRPLGYLSFWMDAKWAGYSPVRWHCWSVALHLVNTLLVFALARQLDLGKAGSLTAGLMFGLHGSRPEAVAWVAARFDLLAAFFVLLALLSTLRYCATGQRRWLAGVVVSTAAGLLSKESAYCLPLLVPLVVVIYGSRRRPDASVRVTFATVAVTSGLVFAFRTFVLRGIGGYGAEQGAPTILQFNLLHSLNALFFREWALLFFPIDWAAGGGFFVWLGLSAGVMALLVVLLLGQGSRLRLLLALGMTVAAALPVQHLLLIGSDLAGVRVLYLPALGLAIFWGLIVQGLAGRRLQVLTAASLIWFQFAALEHNLQIWREAARLSQRSCAFLAGELAADDSPIAVLDVPATWRGAYFLHNSLEACVVLNSSEELKQPPRITPDLATAKHVYQWVDSGFHKLR